MVDFDLVRPTHALANDSMIRRVYVEIVRDDVPGTWVQQVAIDYHSGVLIMMEPAARGFASDPEAAYRSMAAGMMADVYVTALAGVPALAIAPGTDGDRDNPAAVDLTIDRVRTRVFGMYGTFDLATILSVAETLG